MPDHLAKAKQEFESALLAFQKKRKSKVFAIVHDFESHHLCTPNFQAILRDRDKFAGIDTLGQLYS